MIEPKEIKAISKEHIHEWLAKLHEFQIFAPVRRENYSEFTLISDSNEIDLELQNAILSPKEHIFAQARSMFKFDAKDLNEGSQIECDDFTKTPKQLLFGIRPCDSHGIACFDPTFNAEFKDPYYISLRENTYLVALACNDPDINCFCKSVGGGPFDGSKVDILMVDVENSYLFNIYSEKGSELLELYPELFDSPTTEQLTSSEVAWASATAKINRTMETSGKSEKLGEIFESDYWSKIAKKCLGCGICTYLCPTCYCFDITDETKGNESERVRTWDSCMYSEYTVHASGYNPRPARMNRLRNRVYHKFKYYPDLHNIFGCTGCGRCIRHCPVNIDIIDIVNGI